jgi:hypothetical protein
MKERSIIKVVPAYFKIINFLDGSLVSKEDNRYRLQEFILNDAIKSAGDYGKYHKMNFLFLSLVWVMSLLFQLCYIILGCCQNIFAKTMTVRELVLHKKYVTILFRSFN